MQVQLCGRSICLAFQPPTLRPVISAWHSVKSLPYFGRITFQNAKARIWTFLVLLTAGHKGAGRASLQRLVISLMRVARSPLGVAAESSSCAAGALRSVAGLHPGGESMQKRDRFLSCRKAGHSLCSSCRMTSPRCSSTPLHSYELVAPKIIVRSTCGACHQGVAVPVLKLYLWRMPSSRFVHSGTSKVLS